jgi:competence protein ComEA
MTSQFAPKHFGSYQYQSDINQQQTFLCPVTPPPSLTEQTTQPLLAAVQLISTATELSAYDQTEDQLPELVEEGKEEEKEGTQKNLAKRLRPMLVLLIIGLGCVGYFIWRVLPTNSSPAPVLSQSLTTNASKGNTSSSTVTNASGGTIQVYVTGAVQHPGVYTLGSDARVYQLLQAAGGPLPNANLVVLNLAGKLVDGQEIYVRQIGEAPPVIGSTTNNSNDQGQLININTASASDLQQKLRLSAKSAQDIISYRQQHGTFSSVDELLQVVSKSIYDKIKNQVTV